MSEQFFDPKTVKFLQDTFAKGALEKGGAWGGEVCASAVPLHIHIYESVAWVSFCLATFIIFGFSKRLKRLIHDLKKEFPLTTVSPTARTIELVLGWVHVAMYLQIVYYKWNIFSLVNLIQPCHVILLLQGIALLWDGIPGVLITSFMLPALTGTLLAMIFPETTGLDQPFEMEAYWLQHYLIQTVPFYLLIRRNGLTLKHSSLKSGFAGIWILMLLHFSVYEVVDVVMSVNVEFMLCPTGAMEVIFPNLPQWLLIPSYRSTLTVFVSIVGTVITWIYLEVSKYLHKQIYGKSSKSL